MCGMADFCISADAISHACVPFKSPGRCVLFGNGVTGTHFVIHSGPRVQSHHRVFYRHVIPNLGMCLWRLPATRINCFASKFQVHPTTLRDYSLGIVFVQQRAAQAVAIAVLTGDDTSALYWCAEFSLNRASPPTLTWTAEGDVERNKQCLQIMCHGQMVSF